MLAIMKAFKRHKKILIGGVFVLAALAVGAFYFSPPRKGPNEAAGEPSDIVFADSSLKNKEAALAAAIREASSANGRILKLVAADRVVGTGREARIGDTVTVDYIGTVKGGTEFENSYKTHEPLSFKVGAGDVIKGLEEGIVGMKEGGERILIIPPELGYGSTIVEPLPANATLIFSIKLNSIE
jgi:FKBP-type peptidyl-prolyl cis-trans isomerase